MKENPQPKVELRCDSCNINFISKIDEERHLKTKKHLKKTNPDSIVSLECKVCDVKFACKTYEERHMKTNKHIKKTNSLLPVVEVSNQNG